MEGNTSLAIFESKQIRRHYDEIQKYGIFR
jgi:hypothetical protein